MPGRFRGATRRRCAGRHASGSILPVAAAALAVLFGFAGLGIDLGAAYLERRRVQGAADLAALAAVRSDDGAAAARRALADNGYPAPEGLAVTPGTYAADRAVAVADRFNPGGAAPNAVRVRLDSSVRAGFSRVVGGPARYRVSGVATAIRADLAAFGIGSRLLGLDAGIANALLSRLLGANVALSLMDYRALASLRVDALGVLRAAAPRLGLTAGTYDEVLAASVAVSDFAALLGPAAERSGAFSSGLASLNTLAGALSGTGTAVRLAGLLSVGDFGASPVSRTGEALWVNALDLITGAAFLADRTHQVSLDLGAAVPGLTRTRVTMRVGEAWRTSGFVGPGGGLKTAQQRLLVETWIPGPAPLLTLYLPIYLELASARAVVKEIVCPWRAASERSVTLEVATGAASLAVGTVAPGALDPGSPRPRPSPAAILQAPGLAVVVSANVDLATSVRTLAFDDADIRAGRIRTVSAGSLLTSPAAGLLAGLDLQVNGLALLGLPAPKAALITALGAAAAPVDRVLVSLLELAGVRIGAADVAVTGTRCGGAVLVQ